MKIMFLRNNQIEDRALDLGDIQTEKYKPNNREHTKQDLTILPNRYVKQILTIPSRYVKQDLTIPNKYVKQDLTLPNKIVYQLKKSTIKVYLNPTRIFNQTRVIKQTSITTKPK